MADAAIHPELTWRPLRPTDAAAYAQLINEVHAADRDPARLSEEEARHELAHPEIDARGTIAGFADDGRMLARGLVASRSSVGSHLRVFIEGDVHPSVRGRGIGSALLRWLERRAEERVRVLERGVDPEIPRLLGSYYAEDMADRAALYSAAGFAPLRWYHEMRRPLDEPIADAPAPAGLRLMPWTDERSEAARDAHNDAFRDHWGSQPIAADEWRHQHADAPTFRPELSRLALSRDRVVGYVLCHRFVADEAASGESSVWLATLGVRREARRRGLASALITDVLHAIRATGVAAADLGVDSENPTGAVGLYERLGFRVIRRWVFAAKRLAPG